ncbi:resuscitation-promoting factor [Streptomyces chartreusis]|uniref:resuscitation-promoting factor n=1 Tax=Streptomyces chartreusis TaxID=1969 RepID=UPI00123CF7D5|nr:resuscitation-promoting factor [Streptomyces chartreusis]QEV73324.1 resuscitation-promoting factor [Streptomyces chartreusis]
MSNAQFETYGRTPAHEPQGYGGFDPYSAQTLGYGVPSPYESRTDSYGTGYDRHVPHQSYAAYEDTYRPAYEIAEAAHAPVARPRSGRRAAHRRRARAAERGDATMRKLVPQALVVAFLAGGTSAFVAKDKAVELSVDGGKSRTLHTFADDVGDLLAEEGVDVGAHDMVAPAPGAGLGNGDEVAVHYGRPVRLTIDGQKREVWTTARTVEAALTQLGVRAEGAYLSTSRSRRIGREGLALDVRTERAVTVMADGRARTIRTNAASVGEVVEQAGITLRGQDTTSVALESFPRDGQTVTVLRITGRKEIRDEAIPFAVERVDDPSVFKGTEVVERAGQAGLRRMTYTLRTVNGVRQKPRRIRTEVVREPQTQVVKVGTKPLPTSVSGTSRLNWDGLAACESGGQADAVDSSGNYGGLYQFDTHTWRDLGGKGRPQDAPAEEQTMRAKKLYVRQGTSPWPHCGSRLHR